MKTLTAQQVKTLMSSQDDLQVIMTLSPAAFAKSHIPGSINIWNTDDALASIPKDTQIVVYCSDVTCMASYHAYNELIAAGYQNVWRFAGGLLEWEAAGYQLIES